MNLMLVDDDKHVLEGLKKLLDWNSFEGKLTATASNGREALDLIDGTKPDVIISDIRMPVMDGILLAQAIQEKSLDIDIILLSGYGEFEYAQKAIQYHVSKYILKPITRQKIAELQDMLMELCQTKRHKKEAFLSNWDHAFRERVMNALRDNTPDAFDEFFSSPAFIEKLRADASNAFGIQMLNFLYHYLSELNISPEIIASSKENAMNHYWDLPSPDEKSNYLISTFYDAITSIHIRKNKNLASISTYVEEYTAAHYMEPDLNISCLADKMNVSLSYLSTVFKQRIGVNLSTYITTLRLNHGRELLADPGLPISEVAALSGYEDAKYFAKLFKKRFCMTPSEFRHLALQKNSPLS